MSTLPMAKIGLLHPHQWEDIGFDPRVDIDDFELDVAMLEQHTVETRTYVIEDQGLAAYEVYAKLMGSYEYTQVTVQEVAFRFTAEEVLHQVQLDIFTDALDLVITYDFTNIGETTVDLPMN